MRRRSRSPLPEILRRQMHGPPRIPPDTMGGPAAYLLHEDEHIIPAKFEVRENFKEQCILYNEAYFCENGLDLGELGIEALFELEPQPMGEEKQDRVFVGAAEQCRNGEITWSQMTPDEVLEFKKSDLTEWNDLEKGFQTVRFGREKRQRSSGRSTSIAL